MSEERKFEPFITVEQHIIEGQKSFPGASGDFSALLSGITMAGKIISDKVRRAGLADILGAAGDVNVQGEVQQKLDVYANELLYHYLGIRKSVGVLASEENENPTILHAGSEDAKYAIVFDPLDGSSNIDVNVSVGTTFSIMRCPEDGDSEDREAWVLQPGRKQIAAGYILYGSSTILVYSVGNGVHGFTLDPAIGAFVLSHEDMKIPERGPYYSVNESYRNIFPQRYVDYIDRLRDGVLGKPYSSRYIGSMVSDFHRTLLKGGVFLYPPTEKNAEGKLRLLYEANPIAFLAEQAGGTAIDGTRRILDIEPTSIHQRTPLVVGGRIELADFERFVVEPKPEPEEEPENGENES